MTGRHFFQHGVNNSISGVVAFYVQASLVGKPNPQLNVCEQRPKPIHNGLIANTPDGRPKAIRRTFQEVCGDSASAGHCFKPKAPRSVDDQFIYENVRLGEHLQQLRVGNGFCRNIFKLNPFGPQSLERCFDYVGALHGWNTRSMHHPRYSSG